MSKNRKIPEINASSMADIAFLLLIFFLVTTTIDQDKGILHKLPAWTNEPPPQTSLNERNVLEILVNANNQLLVETDYIEIKQLKDIAVKHLNNRGRLPNFSVSPQDAIISLKNDRGTSYGVYLEIQNELKAAYAVVRDEMAYKLTDGKMTYQELEDCSDNPDLDASKQSYCERLKEQIKEEYPMKISEAEPVNLGGK